MEREFKNFIGIDVSKETLDLSLSTNGKIQVHHKVDNKQAAIKKLNDEADRRKALALKKAIPLPQRKTTAFDFLEVERDRMRSALAQPLLSDADVDAHIKSALDAWHAQRAPAN